MSDIHNNNSVKSHVKQAQGLKLSIGLKIMLVTVIILLASMITTSVLTTKEASQSLVNNGKNNLVNLAIAKGITLETYIDAQKQLTHGIATNAAVIAALRSDSVSTDKVSEYGSEIYNSDTIAAYLAQLQEDSGNMYENLFITAGSAGYADCLGNTTLHDVAEENFYIECMKSGYYFGVNVSPVTGDPVYVIAYAVTDPDSGEYIGSVNNSINLISMTENVVKDDYYDVKLFTHEGLALASPDTQAILTLDMMQVNPDAWKKITSTKRGYDSFIDPYSGKLGYIGYDVTDNFVMQVSQMDSDFDSLRKQLTSTSLIILFIALIISILIVILVTSSIIRPLKNMTQTVNQIIDSINKGHGDLTARVKIHGRDESAEIGYSINKFMAVLQDVMKLLGGNSSRLSSISANVGSSINNTNDQVSDVSATMEEMSASSEQISSALNQVAAQVSDITEMVNDVNKKASDQAQAATSILERVENMKAVSIKDRDRADAEANLVIEQLQESMNTAKEVEKIADLTAEILNIAAKTNLLALNASIEAARAGEAGKGFAVVADEIRQLADSSKNTANDIQEISNGVITSVNDLSTKANSLAETFINSNSAGRETVEEITAAYQDDISSAADSMEHFAEDSNRINTSMQNIQTAVTQINKSLEETVIGITNVTNATSEIGNNLSAIKNEADENMTISNELSIEVNKFKYE